MERPGVQQQHRYAVLPRRPQERGQPQGVGRAQVEVGVAVPGCTCSGSPTSSAVCASQALTTVGRRAGVGRRRGQRARVVRRLLGGQLQPHAVRRDALGRDGAAVPAAVPRPHRRRRPSPRPAPPRRAARAAPPRAPTAAQGSQVPGPAQLVGPDPGVHQQGADPGGRHQPRLTSPRRARSAGPVGLRGRRAARGRAAARSVGGGQPEHRVEERGTDRGRRRRLVHQRLEPSAVQVGGEDAVAVVVDEVVEREGEVSHRALRLVHVDGTEAGGQPDREATTQRGVVVAGAVMADLRGPGRSPSESGRGYCPLSRSSARRASGARYAAWTSPTATAAVLPPRRCCPVSPSRAWSPSPPASSTTPASPGSRAVPARPAARAWPPGASASPPRSTTSASTTGSPRRPAAPAPVGDQRIVPDLDRLVVLAAQPGWAWAPGERYAQDRRAARLDAAGCCCGRAGRRPGARGLTVRSAFEIEWVVSRGTATPSRPPSAARRTAWPGWRTAPTTAATCSRRSPAQGVVVEQFHPEYAAGQLELSVAAESPVHAADTSVLVRTDDPRASASGTACRTSFSPKVDAAGVGNGGHVHLSLWRDGQQPDGRRRPAGSG